MPRFPMISKAVTICCSLPTTQQGADHISNCCTACSPCLTPAPRPFWGWWNTRDPIAQSSCIGSPVFKSHHRVDMSDWDGKALGFGWDVMPGNYIKLMDVCWTTLLWCCQSMSSPTLGNVNHLLSVNPTVEVLGSQDGTGPSSLSTFAAEHGGGGGGGGWGVVGGAIIADAKEVECGVLLNWIRAALTMQSSMATPPLCSPHPFYSGG